MKQPHRVHVYTLSQNKKLSYRREITRCFVSLNISPTYSRWPKVIRQSLWCCHHGRAIARVHPVQRQIMAWPWNLGYRSLKITENGTIRKLEYGFLFVFHSNYGSILYHFWYNAICWSNVTIYPFPYPRAFDASVIWQKAPHGGPIPRLGVTPWGRKLYHWIPGVGFPISVP